MCSTDDKASTANHHRLSSKSRCTPARSSQEPASTPVPHQLPSMAPASLQLQLPIGNADTSSANLSQAG